MCQAAFCGLLLTGWGGTALTGIAGGRWQVSFLLVLPGLHPDHSVKSKFQGLHQKDEERASGVGVATKGECPGAWERCSVTASRLTSGSDGTHQSIPMSGSTAQRDFRCVFFTPDQAGEPEASAHS